MVGPVLDWRLAVGGIAFGAIGLFMIRQARNIARQNQNMIDCGEAARQWSAALFGPPWTDQRQVRRIGWIALALGAFTLLLAWMQ